MRLPVPGKRATTRDCPYILTLEPWLSLSVVGQALEWAREQEEALEGEFDSFNSVAMAVLEGLEVDWGEAWITYQRPF